MDKFVGHEAFEKLNVGLLIDEGFWNLCALFVVHTVSGFQELPPLTASTMCIMENDVAFVSL